MQFIDIEAEESTPTPNNSPNCAAAAKPYKKRARVSGQHKMYKRWCFTVNNPGEWRPSFDDTIMDYLVAGYEIGEKGTEHWQGYVRFKIRKRLETVKKELKCEKMHLSEARGTEEENKKYCTKDGTDIIEAGNFIPDSDNSQGKRNDLTKIANKCKEGSSLKEIAEEFPGQWIRYHQGITSLKEKIGPKTKAMREISIKVLYGETGVGKTHRVLSTFPDVFLVYPGRDPWDSYNGEETIFFDEFNWEQWIIQDMNRYLDKWRCPLNCRYHNKYAEWTIVIIAANEPPMSWYPNTSMTLVQALRRRLHLNCYRIVSKEQDLNETQPDECP